MPKKKKKSAPGGVDYNVRAAREKRLKALDVVLKEAGSIRPKKKKRGTTP